MASRRCSHWAVVTGSRSVSGGMSMRDWPSGVDTRDLPLAAMNPRPLRVSRILARVASVPMPSFSFKTALALASETKRWTLAIASISEPSENLEGGVVFFLRASTSAQSTASLLPTDGSDCSASFFLASSSSSSAAKPVQPGSMIIRPRASHAVSTMVAKIFWAS